jgi:glucosamine-6-phosphate deaminase
MRYVTNPISVIQKNQLTVKVYSTREALGEAAGREVADLLIKLLSSQQKVNVVFASAPSQNEFLETLSVQPGIDWSRVTALHVDEYIGLAPGGSQTFAHYLRRHLFNRVHPGVVHYLDGSPKDLDVECARYTAMLRENPVDILCAGIGENGHLAFNDPGVADFLDPAMVKVVELDETCRFQQVHDGSFMDIAEVPKRAITLTIPALLTSRWVYCIVPGPSKAEAVKETLCGEITQKVPASILRIHPRSHLYVDTESAAKWSEKR